MKNPIKIYLKNYCNLKQILTNQLRLEQQHRAMYFLCLWFVRTVTTNHKYPMERDLNHLEPRTIEDVVIYYTISKKLLKTISYNKNII